MLNPPILFRYFPYQQAQEGILPFGIRHTAKLLITGPYAVQQLLPLQFVILFQSSTNMIPALDVPTSLNTALDISMTNDTSFTCYDDAAYTVEKVVMVMDFSFLKE